MAIRMPCDRAPARRDADNRLHSIVRDRGSAPLFVIALAVGGCAMQDESGEVAIGSSALAATVGDQVASDCSTSVVLGLSRQISNEVTCLEPDAFTKFEEGNGIVFTGSAVLPYLSPAGKRDLEDAVAAHGGQISINSAFRTLAQQYLLVQWHDQGRCGITAAAAVGSSNHESGRALDIGNWGDWVGALGNQGWAHTVPGDEVHFDHTSSPDLRGYDVLAFQRLWNRNHADDQIDEDGLYGPQTEDRLIRSPSGGFAVGACGGTEPWDAELVATEMPAELQPGARANVLLRIKNTGGETWREGATFLGTAAPMDRDSELYDPDSWVAPNRVATVSAETRPGDTGELAFTILAPDSEQVLTETFKLVEDGVSWFGPPVDLEIVVSSDATVTAPPPPPGESSSSMMGGGCSASGTASPLGLAVLGLALFVLRRRR
jgi:MYXO-CTERM domain-containing protein